MRSQHTGRASGAASAERGPTFRRRLARFLAPLFCCALLPPLLLHRGPGPGATAAAPPSPRAFTNSIGMRFVLVPRGRFLMGGAPGEARRCKDETRHPVTISSPYYLGAFEVTQDEYETVTGRDPSYHSPRGRGRALVKGLATE